MPNEVADDTVVNVSGGQSGAASLTDTLGIAGQNTSAFFALNDMDGPGSGGNNAVWTFDITSATAITDITIDLAA